MAGLIDRFVRFAPRPDVDYTGTLVVDDPKRTPLRALALGIGSAMLALFGFVWLYRGVPLLIAWLGWTASGSPGVFIAPTGGVDCGAATSYYQAGVQCFAFPMGMVAAHLGIAMAIPLTMALVLFVHRFHPHWLASVQPGFRWRYALAAALAAIVVLGGVWAISRIGQPWTVTPEPQFWGFAAAILLTSPLQAAGEEFLFRGFLLQTLYSAAPNLNRPLVTSDDPGQGAAKVTWSLAKGYQRWFGVIGSALLFALFHTQYTDLAGFLHPFVFGLIAGWLVLKTGGLEAGIAAHVINNLFAFGWADLSKTMVDTRSVTTIGWAELAVNLFGFALFAVAAVWIARRMNLATTTPSGRFGGRSAALVK